MNIIFFGNTKYSVIDAKKLYEVFGLSAIVTIPDKPKGRKKTLTESPTKQFALQHTIPLIETDSFDHTIIDKIKKRKPDFFVVADYGLFLPNELLVIPSQAPLNIHHSLLPKYQGPSPAPTAILNGEKVSGVTIIRMSADIDAGDILAQKEYTLAPDETTDSLLTTLNTLGAQLVVELINQYIQGTVRAREQNTHNASYTKHIQKEDGYFDSKKPPSKELLDRMIRAYYPWPTVWTCLSASQGEALQGKILKFLPNQKLQLEGGKPMSIKDFLNGYPTIAPLIQKLYNASHGNNR